MNAEQQTTIAQHVRDNLATVRGRINDAALAAGRDPAAVTLMAVSKTITPLVIALAHDAGVTTFGENRVQELQAKVAALPELRWELIGTLQRNKVRAALEVATRIQSVDSIALAEAIERIAAETDRIIPVLLQVNVVGEATKHGVTPTEAITVVRAIARLPHLRGEGLMTVAPAVDDQQLTRPVFAAMRVLRDRLRDEVGATWTELSMGMSDDFPMAIAEGATIVRIGRALFGPRTNVL